MRSNDPENSKEFAKNIGVVEDGDSESYSDDGGLIGSPSVSEKQQQHDRQHRLGIPGVAAASTSTAAAPRKTEDSNISNSNSNDANITSQQQHPDYFQQNAPAAAAAMFASYSPTSSHHSHSSTRESSHEHNHRHHHQSKRKHPLPHHYDSRPNLKNDLSYSYQERNDNEVESDQNIHRQLQLQQKQQYQQEGVEIENTPSYQHHSFPSNDDNRIQENYRIDSNDGSGPINNRAYHRANADEFNRKPSETLRNNSESFDGTQVSAANAMNSNNSLKSGNGNNELSDSRPLHRPGKAPAPTAKAIEPKLFAPRLGHRGLSLVTRLSSSQQHPLNFNGAGSTLEHHDDPQEAILRERLNTIRVECAGCKNIIERIPKNAIALECPRCREFHPTVTCRIVQ